MPNLSIVLSILNIVRHTSLTCLPRLFSLAPLRILAISSNLRSLYPGSVKGRSYITLFSAPMSSTRSAHMLGSLLAADTSAVSSSLLPETSCQIINGCALFYGRKWNENVRWKYIYLQWNILYATPTLD